MGAWNVWSRHVPAQRTDHHRYPRLSGPAVRHRLLRRSPAPTQAAPAGLGLQPVAGRLLHQLDLLRRGRPGRRPALVLPAHLPGAHPLPAAGAATGEEDGADQQEGKHHLHRRLHRLPLWQVADAGHRRRADLPGRRPALPGAAAQGHRHRRQPADRHQCRVPEHPRPGHRAVRLPGAGGLRHPVRHPQPGRHRAPPRHDAGDRLRIPGQARRLHRRRPLGHLWPARRLHRSAHPLAAGAATAGILARNPGLAGAADPDRRSLHRRDVPAAPVPRHRGGKHRHPGRQPGALGVSALSGAGRAVRHPHRPGRPVAPTRRCAARLLRHQPAAGPGASLAGPAGLSGRRLGGHRHGDRRLRRPLHHDLQRHRAALAAQAPRSGRESPCGVQPLDAHGAPRQHRGHSGPGLLQLSPAGLQRQPGHHRPPEPCSGAI